MLPHSIRAEIVAWFQTLSPPRGIAANEDAAGRELELLVGVFERAAIKPEEVREVFRAVKETAETRSWPTSKELIEAISRVRGTTKQQDPSRGDKSKLSHDEMVLLENKILPTARRWLSMPGLDTHGIQTLDYWGESYEIPMHLRSRDERQRHEDAMMRRGAAE
jgi:hypothetical protein